MYMYYYLYHHYGFKCYFISFILESSLASSLSWVLCVPSIATCNSTFAVAIATAVTPVSDRSMCKVTGGFSLVAMVTVSSL